ncbi:hypothetical protein [Bacillus smithii]|uniref:hypothetical protein n=1 Tax=Bacillus smithii TaxID=1479 RepID=UPI0022E08F84|nr:hypothetical protein [Bacillus smithii]
MYGSVLKEQLVATKKVNWKWKKEALTVFHLLGRLKNGKENDSFQQSVDKRHPNVCIRMPFDIFIL